MNIQKANPKLIDSSLYMMKNHPFYSEILLGCNFFEDKTVPTAGVNVTFSGFNFYYNNDFLNALNEKQINFLIVHEIYHLLSNHCNRKNIENYNHTLANVVQDMIINTSILQTYGEEFEVPAEELYLIPEEYNGELIYEILYDWLIEKKKEQEQNQKNNNEKKKQEQGKKEQDKNKGQKQDQQKSESDRGNSPEKTGKNGSLWGEGWEKVLDNLNEEEGFGQIDIHFEDEVPEEIREAMIKDIIQSCTAKGIVSNNIEVILGKIRKSRKNYLNQIKFEISMMMGKYKEKTWQRFSRRGSDSMSKGCKKYQKEMNVVLDTSGSMGKDFEKALSYVFFHGITMNMVQCDTEVKKVSKITSLNQLKKEKIVGLGGTTLSPALDYIATDKKMRNLPTLILTDGYTDTLRVNQLSKQCLILSNGVTCPVDSNNKVKQIIIDKEVK
jgi:predicted metal-dependent peptidase